MKIPNPRQAERNVKDHGSTEQLETFAAIPHSDNKTRDSVHHSTELEVGITERPRRGGALELDSPTTPNDSSADGSGKLARRGIVLTSLAPRVSGERMPARKERSSRNALKHGIFSGVAVLKGESRGQFESLLTGLSDTLHPVGTLEKELVDKLATTLWRHRRLVIAEVGEIRRNIQFMRLDQDDQHQEEAQKISSERLEDNEGLIGDIKNPSVLKKCLELLAKWREDFAENSFTETDSEILKAIYGDAERPRLDKNLYDDYLAWFHAAGVSIQERYARGYPPPDGCKQRMLKRIDEEIRRLKRYQKRRAMIEADRLRVEALCRSVPTSGALELLVRYEAHLERLLDRALSQLERLQRMRLGYPLPPPVKVELSP